MSKRLLVLSFDALGGEDYDYMKTRPEFREFFERAAVCTNVASVYPSVTYACHTSIVTGRLPVNHGIISNTKLQPKRVNSPDWYWQRKYVKGDTIYDAAMRNGMKVGAFLWPVTAQSKINYILPEIFPNRKWDNQVMTSLRNGTPRFILALFKRYRHLLNGIKQPNLDDFVTQSVIHTLKIKAPELMLVHFTDLDTARHDYGVKSPEAYAAIDRLATRFEKITQTLKAENLYDETTIVILGDHFQIDYQEKVPLNDLLATDGWLKFTGSKITNWSALAKSNGGSAYVYLKDGSVQPVTLKKFLEKLQSDPKNGIERILTGAEAAKLGADGGCAFMLEAKEGFVFTDSLGGGDKGFKADHGYHPTDKFDYATFYAMAGPLVKGNVVVDAMSLIDIAPTWAKMLGLELGDVDGKIIWEMLNDE